MPSESFINLTEGSGKKARTIARTIGSNDIHESVVLPGEPVLPVFVACYAAATTTSASHAMQIMSGSSNYTRVLRIEAYVYDWPAAASLVELDLFRLTSAGTGGTALNPVPMDPADSATATVMLLPTSKGTEGNWMGRIAIPMGTAAANTDRTIVWEPPARGKPFIISPGTSNGLAIKVITGVASSGVFITIWFAETAWA